MTFSQLLNANGERTDRKGRKVGPDGFTEMQQNPCGMTPTSCVPAVSRKEDFKGDGNDVGALVAKSKKAAASLYTLLHAKNCRIGVNRCSHTGCPEAKLMYLHLKTCSAGPGSPCPTEYKGCGDARKLLAHYRRCRDIRARQASNPRVQQHVCLVCTLVARQVKGSLDSIRSNSPRNRRSKHLIPSLNLSSEGKMKNPNQLGAPVLNRPRSMSPPRTSRSVSSFSLLDHEGKGSCSTPKKMPPPLPRFPFSNRAGLSEQLKRCERPSADVNPAEDDILGKSLDSATGFSRSRARSLDIRQTYGNFCHVDWEEDQRPLESESLSDEKEPASEDTQVQPRLKGRRRSASCTVPSSSHSSSGVCDTIHEEPVGEELQRILEGDT